MEIRNSAERAYNTTHQPPDNGTNCGACNKRHADELTAVVASCRSVIGESNPGAHHCRAEPRSKQRTLQRSFSTHRGIELFAIMGQRRTALDGGRNLYLAR